MKNQFYVLHIEDDSDDVFFFKKVFMEMQLPIEFHYLSTAFELGQYCEKLAEGFYSHFPDVIILDWKMPGSSGESMLKILRQSPILNKKPVIVFSSSDRPKDIEVAYNLGISGFIQKPEDLATLRTVLKGFCEYWFAVCTLPSN